MDFSEIAKKNYFLFHLRREGVKIFLIYTKNCDQLTCDVEHGVPASGATGHTGRHTPVHTRVLLLLAVHRPQEEQASVRQHDPAKKGRILLHCKKMLSFFPSPAGISLTKLSLAVIN
jgi:hypothetical protein